MPTIDPANPVVQAIARGVQAEQTGDVAGARTAYQAAWDAAQDDFERCMAAHYVPRTIDDPKEKLRWNEEALRLALAVGDERVRGFMASLHGCVGQCRLALGDVDGAREALAAANTHLPDVPEGPYKEALTTMIQTIVASAPTG